jgi:hypothetical protein
VQKIPFAAILSQTGSFIMQENLQLKKRVFFFNVFFKKAGKIISGGEFSKNVVSFIE